MSSKQSTKEQIEAILELRDDGLIARGELTGKMAGSALLNDFFDYLDLIPSDTIDKLKEYAKSSIAHPEDSKDLVFFSVLK